MLITAEQAKRIDFNISAQVFEVICDVALNSTSQDEITESLTNLRTEAEHSGKLAIYDELLEKAKKFCTTDKEFIESGFLLRSRYTLNDFKYSDQPFEEVYRQDTQYKKKRMLECIATEAKKVGYTNVKGMYKLYEQQKKNVKDVGNYQVTQFPDQPLELMIDGWYCDETGIYRHNSGGGFEYACRHPLLLIKRYTNIDTLEEKLTIAYLKGDSWRQITASKTDLFDASKVIKFANYGIAVTSKSAKFLSEFLNDIETMNYDSIPQQDSISKLGYLSDGRFSPYVDDLYFDGDTAFGNLYNAIHPCGEFEKWLEVAKKCRKESMTAHILLASSFASVLIEKLSLLPFFVHLWGVDSGTGKTVALMLGASVWGNCELGTYIQTFNSTQVGHEKTASFLRNIPMCIDELQLSKDSKGRSKFDVYQLAQGVGRTRGNKYGGVDKTSTWSLCILTTGESPIVDESAGAGAMNRVIDIECKSSQAVIKDGFGTCQVIKQNYGHAGKKFVEGLSDEVIERARKLYDWYFRELSQGSTTEKQAMSASVILTADKLADELIFHTGKSLTTAEISEFLKSKKSVSAGERGYSYMCDWVAMNANKFSNDNANSDVYGILDGDYAYINQSVFRSATKNAGFDDRALLSWLKENNLILTRGRNLTRGKRINGVNTECVVMQLNRSEEQETYSDFEELL